MAVRLSALRAGRPLPPGKFLVLISVRVWVDLRALKVNSGKRDNETIVSDGLLVWKVVANKFNKQSWTVFDLHSVNCSTFINHPITRRGVVSILRLSSSNQRKEPETLRLESRYPGRDANLPIMNQKLYRYTSHSVWFYLYFVQSHVRGS
jgi:hypothetical protein